MALDNFQPVYDDGKILLYQAECVSFMQSLPANSIDAIVTDPPYLISFMNRAFDQAHKNGHGANEGQQMQAWHYAWAVEALRCAKPGAYLLAFGGTRTSHRLACALEDAGWEIRDTLMFLYGSGFPKSHNISAAIDREAGVEREVVGFEPYSAPAIRGNSYDQAHVSDRPRLSVPLTFPATDAWKQWEGWGSALKSAWEPIILARKPLQGTLAQNTIKWGVGGLNIAASRIGTNNHLGRALSLRSQHSPIAFQASTRGAGSIDENWKKGRWPANLLLSHHETCKHLGIKQVKGQNGGGMKRDGQKNAVYAKQQGHAPLITVGYADDDGMETVDAYRCHPDCPVAILDAQSGTLTSGKASVNGHRRHTDKFRHTYQPFGEQTVEGDVLYGDSGYASRFFYTAKADRAERGEGNTHPTVKPLDLMQYLIVLVTPPGGLILDPFAGSGTTLLAARGKGMRCIGVEQEHDYCVMALDRLDDTRLPLFRID